MAKAARRNFPANELTRWLAFEFSESRFSMLNFNVQDQVKNTECMYIGINAADSLLMNGAKGYAATTCGWFEQNNAPGFPGYAPATGNCGLESFFMQPITVINFNVKKREKDVLLSWTTASELRFDHFEIERSANGTDWLAIAKIPALDNSIQNNYSFTDDAPMTGTNCYRIKSITIKGQFFYSLVKLIQFTNNGPWTVSISPNPVISAQLAAIHSNEPLQTIRVFDINGREVLVENMHSASVQRNVVYAINTSGLAQGMYLLKIVNSKGTAYCLKFIKKN